MVDEDAFAEWAEVHGNLYGTALATIEDARRNGVDLVLGVRGLARFIAEGADAANVTAEFVATPEHAGEWLRRNVKPGDVVLLKASRGVRLERALDLWMGKAADNSH